MRRLPAGAAGVGIHKIKHIIMIMQENRSFDEYFGTFPGADGIPMKHGHPTVCNPDPKTHKCVKPYVDHHNNSSSPPHSTASSAVNVNRGKMDGFIRAHRAAECDLPTNVICGRRSRRRDGLSHQARHPELLVVREAASCSRTACSNRPPHGACPAHLYMVSGWSARCANHNAFSCVGTGKIPPDNHYIFSWTDLTYLLHKNSVSWGYYVVKGLEPDCEDDETLSCVQHAAVGGDAEHLEPASLVRHRADRTASSATSSRSPRFYKAAKQGRTAGRLVDRAVESSE